MLVQASQDALRHLEIIMVGTKFPENIGMAARACANTGCGRLTLVSPAWWDKEKARPLATAKGEPLLDAIEVKPTLGDALAPNVLTFGTTARTGGWRRGLLTPEQAAGEIAPLLHEGSRVAIVFGCEDRGLSNADIEQCQRLVTIPAWTRSRRSATIPASSRAASRTRNRPCSTPGSKKRSSPSTISKATIPTTS